MKDTLIPPSKWVFDSEVVNCFDDMLRRSIPQYEVMRRAVFDLGRQYVKPGTHIVDIGCSKGEALAPFVAAFGTNNKYDGLDVSKPMLDAARVRFQNYIKSGIVRIAEHDLKNGCTIENASLTLSVLAVQFVPLEFRPSLLKQIYDNTVPGGAFIMVDKILGATPDIDAQMIDLYHAMKKDNNYTAEQIEKKRRSLEGVLIPLTAKQNEDFMKAAGFTEIDCFWRWMNFAGWIAIKK